MALQSVAQANAPCAKAIVASLSARTQGQLQIEDGNQAVKVRRIRSPWVQLQLQLHPHVHVRLHVPHLHVRLHVQLQLQLQLLARSLARLSARKSVLVKEQRVLEKEQSERQGAVEVACWSSYLGHQLRE